MLPVLASPARSSHPMSALILSFLTSLVVTLFVVRSASSHERLSADFDVTGPQKFHSRPVPRIGLASPVQKGGKL